MVTLCCAEITAVIYTTHYDNTNTHTQHKHTNADKNYLTQTHTQHIFKKLFLLQMY